MAWLADTAERRSSPTALWPEVRSIVMLGMNYGPERDPLESLAERSAATISVYARNRDYHDLIKGALKRIATRFATDAGADVKVFVDTAPVMEKPLAAAAGLGWQGKHTNLVSREFGSWLFLGAIFTTAELAPDRPEADHCGSCRACLDICPTKAFPAPYRLDARRCISYLTIEHHGPIPRALRPLIGNHIFGHITSPSALEQVRGEGPPGKAFRARRSQRGIAEGLRPARRPSVPKSLLKFADQADRPRPFCAQCACGDRQFRRSEHGGGGGAAAR
jgi:epoxyqueuosine reductase